MNIRHCVRVISIGLLTLAVLAGNCRNASAQSAAGVGGGDERIVVVMKDGTSLVHQMTDQSIKIKTAAGERAVPMRKLIYIFNGKARAFSEQGILGGEVLDTSIPVGAGDGPSNLLPLGEILFLGAVQTELSEKMITGLQIIVADEKVTRTVFSAQATADAPAEKQTGAAKKKSTAEDGAKPRGIGVLILDEYQADKRFILSNPSYNAVVKKVASTFPGVSGPPFPLKFDIAAHQPSESDPEITLLAFYTEKGSGKQMSRWRRFMPADSGPLSAGSKKTMEIDLGFCLGGLEGAGELYFYVAEADQSEVHDKGPSKVEVYKTVSNVLRLPVRFE